MSFFSKMFVNAKRNFNEIQEVVSPSAFHAINEIAAAKAQTDLAVKNTVAAAVVKGCLHTAQVANWVEQKAIDHGTAMALSAQDNAEELSKLAAKRHGSEEAAYAAFINNRAQKHNPFAHLNNNQK